MKSTTKTMMGIGLAGALALVVGQARADEATSAASDETASTAATAYDESAASAEEVGAGGAEPGRMSEAMAQDSAQTREQQLNHDEWVRSIWYGP